MSFSACAVKTVEGFEKGDVVEKNYTVSYFSDASADYVYKANISIYGKEFGGIFIAKKIDDTTHRVAFTTEFGNKLFDFTIAGNDFKVNYILEDLDRKIIVNMLKKDFILLLKNNYPVMEVYQNNDYIVYKSKDDGRYNYLFFSNQSKHLEKLVNATNSKEKVIISYIAENYKLAKKIVIDHKNIKLRIELNYINN
ncbi:MAG: hypothetical protein EOO45_23575 [Flavobacterium sp.]|nr:MAG: hypothetical protein EOO45_23575 [Flavobacterium sp.]